MRCYALGEGGHSLQHVAPRVVQDGVVGSKREEEQANDPQSMEEEEEDDNR